MGVINKTEVNLFYNKITIKYPYTCSITFGETSLYIDLYPNSPQHLEEDLLRAGRILYTDGVSLRYTDGLNSYPIVTKGLGEVRSFIQISAYVIIALDLQEHCLKSIDRRSGRVAQYAGKCKDRGDRDGSLSYARFDSPLRALRGLSTSSLYKDKVYINTGKSGLGTIRVLDLRANQISTLTRHDNISEVGALQWDVRPGYILLTRRDSVYRLRITSDKTKTPTVISGDHDFKLFRDGALETARYHSPTALLILTRNVYLLADTRNNKLRVLDFVNRQASTICTGNIFIGHNTLVYGPVNECQLERPLEMLLMKDMIYISMKEKIVKLEGM